MRYVILGLLFAVLGACGNPETTQVASVAPTASTPSYSDPVIAIAGNAEPLTTGGMVEAVPVNSGETLIQAFKTCAPINGLKMTVVTWNQAPTSYPISWVIKNASGASIAAGVFDASKLTDWQTLSMPAAVPAGTYELQVSAPAGPLVEHAVGVALSAPSSSTVAVALRGEARQPLAGAMQVSLFAESSAAC